MTITLPSIPPQGTKIKITDIIGNFNAFPVTVQTTKFRYNNTDVILDLDWSTTEFMYVNTIVGWTIL